MQIKPLKEEKKIWRDANNAWGNDHAFTMAMEELAETIVALAHYKRGRASIHDVLEEFGDAFVCVGQVIHSAPFAASGNTAGRMEIAIEQSFDKLFKKLKNNNKNHSESR